MLQRLGPSVVRAGETSSPALFASKLEFNPPVHGPWNIVHLGTLVPESHQIYVCAINCMRGVVLTAYEMGAQDRFSCVVLKEEDILRGTVDEVTRAGIADVLHKLERRGALPPCVMVFPVCTHHFLGVHMEHIYRELEQEFPGVDFVRAFMDPIMNRHLTPDQRLRRVMYDPLPACEPDPQLVAHLGSDFALDADCELRALLAAGGYTLREPQDCASYAEYKDLARASLLVATYPNAQDGIARLAKRLGRTYLYLPASFDYAEIAEQSARLCAALGLPLPDFEAEQLACDEALAQAREVIGMAPITIDVAAHPRPLGMARLLLEHGFNVTEVYLDGASVEDAPALDWLREHAPELQLSSIVLPELRIAPRTRPERTLAIGQKAAWFCGTPHFVNMVEGAGLWGFAGIRGLARLMVEAWAEEKDTHDLVPRKGLGCVTCAN
ncbi:MAG: nitrogenase component 1 [Coriobacteriales bacterium]|nr:nitrogenase component 1 [Coriobacteriales bacterium]